MPDVIQRVFVTVRPAVIIAAILLVVGCDARKRDTAKEPSNPKRPTFQESDPYEALSPLSWSGWSDDLFKRGHGKPVLLAISGKWCHWCHIYDERVFSDPDLAAFIQKNFALVRVDPDERPDIDQRYNQGGWPTICVLTPDGDLVEGTTYDPDHLRPFLEEALARARAGDDSLRTRLRNGREQAARAQAYVKEPGALDPGVLAKIAAGIKPHFDTDYGGFLPLTKNGSKLAVPSALTALLEGARLSPGLDPSIREFVHQSAEAMSRGAIHDQLFSGFFRSCSDRAWSLPDFEKLLDVQADMIELYLAASSAFGSTAYMDVARSTIDFVRENLANPDSTTFANCLDPDIGPGDDGRFYTWTVSEVDSLLSPDEARVVKLHFGIAPLGEVLSRPNANTLLVTYTAEEEATRLGLDVPTYTSTLERATARMRAFRLAGPRPRVDATAFSGPNLRFASALLGASAAPGAPGDDARASALRTIDFFTAQHIGTDGLVSHAWNGTAMEGPTWLPNQVAGIEACLRAYKVTKDDVYLARAKALLAATRATFRSEVAGSYWDVAVTSTGPARLQLKMRPIGTNVRLADGLMDLFVATSDAPYRQEAEQVLTAFSLSFGSAGFDALPYAVAVHRLIWALRGGPVVTS